MQNQCVGSAIVPVETLTHKWLETHEYVISTVATAALVLKHQVISNHSAD